MSNKAHIFYVLVGAALMGYCGSTLNRMLDAGVTEQFILPGFAIGLILFPAGAIASLRSRVDSLERQLAARLAGDGGMDT